MTTEYRKLEPPDREHLGIVQGETAGRKAGKLSGICNAPESEQIMIDYNADPRGPIRTSKSISRREIVYITLDCGHIAKCNPAFSYKVGEKHHCITCKMITDENNK